MRRSALWGLLVVGTLVGVEALSLVGLRLVEGRWTAPAALAEERGAVAPAAELALDAPAAGADADLPPNPDVLRDVLHPYLGFVLEATVGDAVAGDPLRRLGFRLDATPIPHPAGPDDFVVLLFGGSVAQGFEPQGGAVPLVERLRDLPAVAGREIQVGTVALGGYKQPQQLLALTYLLALGMRVDLVINLDGFNEATLGPEENLPRGVATFFPRQWALRIEDTPDRRRQAMLGEVVLLRERRDRWIRRLDRPLVRWSPTAALLRRLGERRLEGRIALLESAFVAGASDATDWRIAPPRPEALGRDELVRDVASVWRESSRQMDRLARANGAHYVHFLQPNQYVRGAKPMGPHELATAVARDSWMKRWVARVYPHLRSSGADLRASGVAFFDLTEVFAEVEEPLYLDVCCHFSDRGYEILGRAMGEAIAEEGLEWPVP